MSIDQLFEIFEEFLRKMRVNIGLCGAIICIIVITFGQIQLFPLFFFFAITNATTPCPVKDGFREVRE